MVLRTLRRLPIGFRGLPSFSLPVLPYDYGALQQLDGAIDKGDATTAAKLQSATKFNGGASDVTLWRRRRVSCGIIIVATFFWLLVEHSRISFLSLCSDILLILIVLLFVRANYAVLRKKQLQTLPELILSEEMVNNAAASFRVKVNYMLLMAHDITLGKDFRLFFVVVITLWILSVVGSLISFSTLAYIGILISITIPALYDKFKEPVDRCAGILHRKFSKHYKIVDGSLQNRLPRSLSKDKDA